MAVRKHLTIEQINKLPEGTILWCTSGICTTPMLGKLHFHEGAEAVFRNGFIAWSIKNPALYTLATDEEAFLYKLENA